VHEPALGLKTSLLNGGSFLKRIQENLLSVWKLPWAPLPPAHAPIHLLDKERTKPNVSAQAGSVLIHALAFGALIVAFTQWTGNRASSSPTVPHRHPVLEYWPRSEVRLLEPVSLGKAGGGGDRNPQPPASGNLAALARIELAPPRLPDGRVHPLPQTVSIFDSEAPEFVESVNDLGLPWMPALNSSAGSGPSGIGNTPGSSMGRNGPNGSGEADSSLPYNRVASQVVCRVCPDPLYSEEARQTKLQGSVVLSVLVGADGRAKDVRVVRGLGMGLEENAIQAIRNWEFVPAKDAAQRPFASWIKVETVFRLF